MKLIGLFGGTFDPLHSGHLQSAAELQRELALDELRLVPCHRPSHRGVTGASSAQRLAMVEAAVAELAEQNSGGEGLQVDDRECRREQHSYSIDTLMAVRAEVGDSASLCLIVGTDAFAKLDSWHRWQELLDYAHILVMARPHSELPVAGPVAELVRTARSPVSVEGQQQLHNEAAGSVFMLTLTPHPISATEVRRTIADGGDWRQWLPVAVSNYIEQHRLYR